MPESNKRPPDESYMAGCCEAAIWKEEKQEDGRTVVRHRIHVQKRYKDKEGNWQSSGAYLFPEELGDLERVVRLAGDHTRVRRCGSGHES